MGNDIYSGFNEKQRAYFEFFSEFKEHLAEYIKLNHPKTMIWEMIVPNTPITLYKDLKTATQLQIKNQGDTPVLVSTDKLSGYRLDPDENIQITINHPISFLSPKGEGRLGFIQH